MAKSPYNHFGARKTATIQYSPVLGFGQATRAVLSFLPPLTAIKGLLFPPLDRLGDDKGSIIALFAQHLTVLKLFDGYDCADNARHYWSDRVESAAYVEQRTDKHRFSSTFAWGEKSPDYQMEPNRANQYHANN